MAPFHKNLSVIVCTYNRSSLLDRMLESLYQQTLNKDCWELIIVDNNSLDETKNIVDKWGKTLPIIYKVEGRQGLSFARNTGIELANSQYLLYLDDDVFADPALLTSYFQFISLNDLSNIACLGGKVHIEWEGGKKPDWFPENLKNLYGHYDLGNEVVDSNFAVGCNMLWNREIINKLGKFSTDLGRKGQIKLASEETVLQKKALELGFQIKYIPDALVHHWTPYSRQTRNYLFNLCYWLGISKSKSETIDLSFRSTKNYIKKNIRLLKKLIDFFVKFILAILEKPKLRLESKTVYLWGMVLFVTGNLLQNVYLHIKGTHE